MMRAMLGFVMCFFTLGVFANDLEPSVYQNYFEHCALCHGVDGLGEGLLSTSVDYKSNTNLSIVVKAKTRWQIEQVITRGAKVAALNEFMPPWEAELSRQEISLLSSLVLGLRSAEAVQVRAQLLQAANHSNVQARHSGKVRYLQSCANCHGKTGMGDGRMAKIVNMPPPANLTLSLVPDAYLKKIILEGGEALGRSPQMPPWKDQFTDAEIRALVVYTKTLRVLPK